MAGAKDSASRLGVTLQGYDQVIALSQSNINESLEYYFTAKPALCKFEVTVPKCGTIKATLKPPTIQLIDIENADQALYCLGFGSGDYTFWDMKDNPEDPEAPPIAEKVVIPVKGWKIAFNVDLALKKLAVMPEAIRNQVLHPNSYSVEQLIVDFGTADIMSFNEKESVFKNFTKPGQDATIKAMMGKFIGLWIAQTKAANPDGAHNVLATAVKIRDDTGKSVTDVIKETPGLTPSFAPTAVRLQTINYRPGGDASKTNTSHPYNAFLFTEMTDGNTMLAKDLDWSGDLFYESIGGTLVMSRSIFWDRFLCEKLKFLLPASKTLLDGFYNKMKVDPKGVHSSNTRQMTSLDWKPDGLTRTASASVGWDLSDNNGATQYKLTSEINLRVEPVIAKGQIKVFRRVDIAYSFDDKNSHDSNSMSLWIDTLFMVFLKSVTDKGALVVEVELHVKNPDKPGEYMKYVPEPPANPAPANSTPAESAQGNLALSLSVVHNAADSTSQLETAIQNALSVTSQMVFPGGGTFDMKDPIFNTAGDLMIGLTYRKGDAAK